MKRMRGCRFWFHIAASTTPIFLNLSTYSPYIMLEKVLSAYWELHYCVKRRKDMEGWDPFSFDEFLNSILKNTTKCMYQSLRVLQQYFNDMHIYSHVENRRGGCRRGRMKYGWNLPRQRQIRSLSPVSGIRQLLWSPSLQGLSAGQVISATCPWRLYPVI